MIGDKRVILSLTFEDLAKALNLRDGLKILRVGQSEEMYHGSALVVVEDSSSSQEFVEGQAIVRVKLADCLDM